jgi:hypothetical protein
MLTSMVLMGHSSDKLRLSTAYAGRSFRANFRHRFNLVFIGVFSSGCGKNSKNARKGKGTSSAHPAKTAKTGFARQRLRVAFPVRNHLFPAACLGKYSKTSEVN